MRPLYTSAFPVSGMWNPEMRPARLHPRWPSCRTHAGWHTGLIPRLEDETFITDLRKREDAGPFICTVGAGEVHLRLNVLMRVGAADGMGSRGVS